MSSKNPPPRTDAPGYVREPLKVSDNGKFFTVDAAQVVDLMADYKRWGLLDKDGRVKGG